MIFCEVGQNWNYKLREKLGEGVHSSKPYLQMIKINPLSLTG
jgi:hypothetical protein